MGTTRSEETTAPSGDALGCAASDAPFVSVCIITRRRPEMLDACLAALQRQVDAPPFELLVGCHDDEEAAEVVRERFPSATVGVFDQANPGGARNRLIGQARGEMLLFLDDDVMFGNDLLAVLFEMARSHPEASVFGGPNLTPPASSLLQELQGAALGSVFGAGPVRRRYGAHPAGMADERSFTLCNLAVRRGVAVPFAPQLTGAEENAMLKQLGEDSQLMWYDPRFCVYHERRATFADFARQMLKYGRGRGQIMFRRPRAFRVPYLVPSAFVLWLVSVPIVATLWSSWWALGLLVYVAYLIVAAAAVARRTKRGGVGASVRAGFLGALLTVTIHVFYGVGVMRGLVRTPRSPHTRWTVPSGGPDDNHAVQSARLGDAMGEIPARAN